MPRTDKRSAALLPDNVLCERIVGAAFQAFVEKGYAGTSTLEIATRAKLSKRDLYAAFRNKRAVLLACISSRAARMRLPAELTQPRSREALAGILAAFGATILREVSQPAVTAMFRLAIAEAQRSPEVAEVLEATRSASRKAIAELFARAQAAGVLGAGATEAMTERFFALLWGDLQLQRLLGAAGVPTEAAIERRAQDATTAFLQLYAAGG